MAKDVGQPGIGSALTRLLSLRGRVSPKLEEFIVPTVQVADIQQSAEPAERLGAWAQRGEAAVAGEVFHARFEAPPNVVCHIQSIMIEPDGVDTEVLMAFGNTLGDPGNTATEDYTDGRLPAPRVPAAVLRTGTVAAGLAVPTYRYPVIADQFNELRPEDLIVAGSQSQSQFFELSVTTANILVRMAMRWREYHLF